MTTSLTGKTYGVYGKSNSSAGFGVYSDGNAHVEGRITAKSLGSDDGTLEIIGSADVGGALTWNAKTSYLSLSGFDFYGGAGSSNGTTASTCCIGGPGFDAAPVHLPHGAKVTKIVGYWDDEHADQNFTVSLQRRVAARNFTADTMAEVSSTGAGGVGSATDTTIVSATIDNVDYVYFVTALIPKADLNASPAVFHQLHAVVIEYTTTEPH